jgi:proteasome accessory factor A
MAPILAGIETEYGFTVEGRGAADQIDDAIGFVSSYPGPCFVGWDYRHESPRADLRGFSVQHLAFDPDDAQFDREESRAPHEIRADRVLPNGARFYNDHGHPEYATPETWSLRELALHDQAGERVVAVAGSRFQDSIRRRVKVYKNNSDFHGASYGTHESYLVPRAVGFDRLFEALVPMLVVRQVLTGAGKVGAEKGDPCDFQMSQRADFFSEPANVETLYRRPVFNTRDEPHADRRDWIRLHVISGDANMMASCTRRKVGLVKLALALLSQDRVPRWRLRDPVRSLASISRDPFGEGRVELEGGNWTTPRQILESYLCVADQIEDADPDLAPLANQCLSLLDQRFEYPDLFRRSVDWAAKHWLLDQFRADEDTTWRDPVMQSLDLSYHDLDRDEGLYYGLVAVGECDPPDAEEILDSCLKGVAEPTRALARSVAVGRLKDHLVTASWSGVLLKEGDRTHDVRFDPGRSYPLSLTSVESVRDFIQALQVP